MFRVIVHRRATRYLKKLPIFQKERVKEVLRELGIEPLQMFNVKHMLGEWKGYHRIRIGDIRIFFWINQEDGTVYVDHIGPRGDVYKG